MRVGITGTRNGLSTKQLMFVRQAITWDLIDEIHSGDCVGVDKELHNHATLSGVKSVGHPPNKDKYRAFCGFDESREPKGYFERNRDIVHETDVLYGFPPTEEDVGRGGTWYTINYAIKLGRPVIVVTPSGSLETHNASG